MAGEETIGKATIQLGVDAAKLAPEMAAAVAKAQGTLERANRQMERAHASTMKAIQGQLDKINAVRPTNEMRMLEQAVQKLGGTANLTKDQLGRVTAQVNALAAAGAKVPASLSGLTGMGSKLGAAFQSLTTGGGVSGALAAIGPAGVAAAGALGAVTVAGGLAVREISDLASKAEEWTNEAKRTGLGVVEVQQLGALLQDAGIPAEALTVAMKSLHREIADGGKDLQKYGIDLAAIKDLSPQEQLQAVAQAILNISDVNERGAAAQAAFGKSGETLIPVLDQIAEGGYKVIDALGDKQVAALAKTDDAFDKLARSWTQTKNVFIGGVIEMADAYNTKLLSLFGISDKSPIAESLADFEKRMARIKPDPTGLSLGPETPEQAAAKRAYYESIRKGEAASKKAAEEMLALRRKYNELQGSIVKKTEDEAKAMRDLDEDAKALLETMEKQEAARVRALKEGRLRGGDMLPAVGGAGLWTRHQDVLDQEMENAASRVKEVKEETKDWGSSLDALSQQLQTLAMITGGTAGKILSFAASISSGLGGVLSGLQTWQKSGGGLMGFLGKASGALGIVASAVGVVGGLIKGIKGLFGREQQKQQVSQSREQFISQMGGLDELNRRAAAAGVSLDRLMNARDSVKGFEAAMKDVTAGIEKYEKRIAGLTSAREASESLMDRLDEGGFSETLSASIGELINRVQGALLAEGMGFLKTGPLRESEAFSATEGVAADLAKLIAGMREAGIVDAGSLAAGGAAAKELQAAAVAAATEAGLPATEATRAGFAAIAPVLREQLNASIQSGRELDANTLALLEEAKANGIEIMADPMIQSLAVQREQLGVLRQIAGQGDGGYTRGGEVTAARGFGPMITPNLGGGLGPRIQTHPGELAMVIPRSRMGPGGILSAASGLYSMPEMRRGRGAGSRTTTVNLAISENPFQSAEGAARLRRHTLRTVERETSKHLAGLIAAGGA